MTTLEYISAIVGLMGGGSAIGVAIWYLINIRSKRRVEEANAVKAVAEAEKQHQDNNQDNIDWVSQKIREIDESYKMQNTKIDKIQCYNIKLISALDKADIYHCEDLHCPNRRPELGKYKTIIKNTEQNG